MTWGGAAAFAVLGMTKGSLYHHLEAGERGRAYVSRTLSRARFRDRLRGRNCEWGMEETVLGMPLVVKNRPFVLDVQKSERDLLRRLGQLCGLHDASAQKRG